MTNDQIIKRLLELLETGETVEKVLAAEALRAIVKALEFIPNMAVYDALTSSYVHDDEVIQVVVSDALAYPGYYRWKTYGKAEEVQS